MIVVSCTTNPTNTKSSTRRLSIKNRPSRASGPWTTTPQMRGRSLATRMTAFSTKLPCNTRNQTITRTVSQGSRTRLRKLCKTRWRLVIAGMVAWSWVSAHCRLDMIQTNNSIERRTAWPATCSMCMPRGAASSTSATSSLQSSSETSHYQCRDLRSQPNAKSSRWASSATMQWPTSQIKSSSRSRRRKTSNKQPHLPTKTRLIGGWRMLMSSLRIKSYSSRQLVRICRAVGRPSPPDSNRAVEEITLQ